MIKQTFPVTGMGCASCVSSVEKAVKELPGVQNVSVSLATDTLQVEYDSGILSPGQIRDAVQAAGYDLLVDEVETDAEYAADCRYEQMLKETGFAILFTLIMVLVEMGVTAFPYKTPVLIGMAALFVFYFGRHFLVSAVRQLKHLRASMDTLISVAILVSLFSGNYVPCAMIVTFILIGRTIAERVTMYTSDTIRKLKSLQPEIKCKVGEVIPVKAGERVPADGMIIDGTAVFDESMMTGESDEIPKQMADMVFSGTLCLSGNVMVSVQKVGKGTMLSSIIAMVREAQNSRTKVQDTVDRIAGFFVPAVVMVAIVALIVNGLDSFISVLVIACPCALELAIPTVVVAGIGRAAREGVLVKNADAFQSACRVDIVAFDKTGTLAEGAPGKIRANSREAIDNLKALRLDIVMLSGDKADMTESAATEVGIWKFEANMLPGDKVSYARKMQDEGHRIAMVGDGINDSAALAQADFSMAMGTGADVVMDVAMCTVVVPDLRKVPKMIELSKKVALIIQENLLWAFVYNVCALPLAFMGKVSPEVSAACMALSSVCVVCNSLRLKLHKII